MRNKKEKHDTKQRERMWTSTTKTSSKEAEVPQDYFITIYKFFFVNTTKMLVIKNKNVKKTTMAFVTALMRRSLSRIDVSAHKIALHSRIKQYSGL